MILGARATLLRKGSKVNAAKLSTIQTRGTKDVVLVAGYDKDESQTSQDILLASSRCCSRHRSKMIDLIRRLSEEDRSGDGERK